MTRNEDGPDPNNYGGGRIVVMKRWSNEKTLEAVKHSDKVVLINSTPRRAHRNYQIEKGGLHQYKRQRDNPAVRRQDARKVYIIDTNIC